MKGSGQQLETAIARIHRHYGTSGRCWAWHTYPPFLIDRRLKGGRFYGRLLGEAPPDYLVFAGGRFLMIEAKTIRKERFPFANLPPHQARQLSIVDGFRDAAGVLIVRCVPAAETIALFWADVEEGWGQWHATRGSSTRAAPGSASLAWAEMRDLAVWIGRGPDVDYLDRVVEAFDQRKWWKPWDK